MYGNILLSTDGSDVAKKGVKHGIALAKALNAKVTVITVTEPLPVDYGSGHASGWIPSQEEFDSFDAACKEGAGKVLELWRSRSGYLQNSCMFRMRTQPLRLSKQQSPEAAT
jgi:nucleotide-binding universal stress UspA family protein